MTRYYLAAAALLALFVVACSIEQADALPLFQHTAAAGFTDVHCLDSGAWSATLVITATNPELHPKATIANPSSPFTVAVPYTHTWTFEATTPKYTIAVHIVWDDLFSQDKGPFTATRPDGCTPPTSGVTSTTICAQANPPRADCNEVTTSPSTTTISSSVPPPTVPGTGPNVSSAPGGANDSTVTPPPLKQVTPTTASRIALPVAGPPDCPVVIGVAIGLAITGAALTITARRRGV